MLREQDEDVEIWLSEGVRFAPSIFILARSPDYSFLGGSVILKFSELRKFFISLINYNIERV